MQPARLRLAEAAPAAAVRAPLLRAPAQALGAALAGFAILATGLGADAARRPEAPTDELRAIVWEAVESGTFPPEARATTQRMRRQLGERPLDARTRVLYAGVLADLASAADDLPAAAFHARRAVALAPVSVPIVRAGALVLMRAGRPEEALALAAAMFAYDPNAAAKLLELLEPFVDSERIRSGIPADPAAWNAWILALRRQGRRAEADASLHDAHARWPADRTLFEAAAAHAVIHKDWDALAASFAAAPPLPDADAYSNLFSYRSRLESARGSPDVARSDAATALRLAGARPTAMMAAGDALEAAGEPDRARSTWTRALHTLPASARREIRAELLLRVARLDERRGHLGDALRGFRDVLDVYPAHPEAERSVERLTGGGR